MNRRLAILSVLLRYPDEALRADLPQVASAITDAGFRADLASNLARLVRRLGLGDALDREEDYVRLFDRGRGTSLHLFEHVHGDTRNRGPAMIELAQVYEQSGFALDARELPDYLPLFLEFCAHAEPGVTTNLLGQCAPILDQLHAKLLGRGTATSRAYAAIVAAVLAEAGVRPEARPTEEQELSDAEELAALDAAYESEPVVFGPESDPDKQGARAKLGAMIDRLRTLRANHAIR
ncbi:nitrate reductase molybdenum cofactor assembly chaperone [Roseomonas sp. AR75]|uniref:nitrate reductase molybdenum cofactor assembly chaperone n=1 Tax=Roseomonas sp. AR75 TaxID=2562311 RepID=UPI001484DDEC|nr:nitrate reductase molybdenum cofactor assembly chaperone [Roseomonas sp. AR75]